MTGRQPLKPQEELTMTEQASRDSNPERQGPSGDQKTRDADEQQASEQPDKGETSPEPEPESIPADAGGDPNPRL
jgi:hypothetical protein